MRTTEAEGLSDKARTLLTDMLNSGDAQQVYIAQALDEIASNGEGQEEDSFLAQCAHEMACEAALVVKTLKPLKPMNPELREKASEQGSLGATSPEVVVDLLGLVDVTMTEAQVRHWTEAQRVLVVEWAGAVHLHASDNDDIIVPKCPFFVPPGDTSKRFAERVKHGEDGYNWKVFVDTKLVGNIHLPSHFDVHTAKRFAYQQFKAKITRGKDWEIQ